MKAWQFTRVGAPLALVELPDPVPGAGEIVIDIKATGICHSDVGFMDGTITSLLGCTPIVLGHEIAGVISAVGAGVTAFKIGQRVGIPATVESPGTARNGGFAEKVCVKAEQCVPIPDAVPFEQATPAMCAGKTAYQAVVTAGQVKSGMKVGVIGFGGLGSLGVQIAKALGAHVYVAEINKAAWDTARKAGAEGVSADIREFESKGLDVVLDFAGYGVTAAAAIDAVRPGGRIVEVGLGEEMAHLSIQKITMKQITFVGASNAGTLEGGDVLKLMAGGNVKAQIIPVAFEAIPESLEKLAKGGVQGRFVATIARKS